MTPFATNIIQEARNNAFYRRVVYTGELSQLVVMTIPPGGDVGEETHRAIEQSIFVVEGDGAVMLGSVWRPIHAGDVIVIPPGVRHNLIAGPVPLRLVTVYTPPNHIDRRVHPTRADAEADIEDEAFGRRMGG